MCLEWEHSQRRVIKVLNIYNKRQYAGDCKLDYMKDPKKGKQWKVMLTKRREVTISVKNCR